MAVFAAVGAVGLLTACNGGATRTTAATAGPGTVTKTVAAPTRTPTATPSPSVSVSVVVTTVQKPAPQSPASSQAPVAAYVDPVAVVQKFYSDLNSKNFRAAWDAGGSHFTNGGDYYSWVAGYANTTGVIGTATDAGGGVVDTEFTAMQMDGTDEVYQGTYTVRNGIIVAGHMHRVN